MSHGSLPSTVQQILCQIVKQWKTDDIYVGYKVVVRFVEKYLDDGAGTLAVILK